ncbi:MAG TPA: lysophospholipid acyltransferase family protein [Pirellulales bacterium]|nr:lysophospholipid acyltransferase family protein [Pirellulales bacterium]
MKITNPFAIDAVGLLATAAIRGWMGTLEYKWAAYEPDTDPLATAFHGQKIYIFWHEYILCPLYLRAHCNVGMLLSQHRDAEYLARIAYHMGYKCIRGSSFRGGATALRELLRKSRGMNLTITPDGPRGPRRKLASGPIYLASKLGMPLVAAGMGYDRPWRMNTWDRFAIPRPGSRSRLVTSPAIVVPPDLDRDGIERYRGGVEGLLNRLTSEAEAWAEAGTAKLEEAPVRREPARRGAESPARSLELPERVPSPRVALPPAA